MRIVGLDLGKKRVGMAMASSAVGVVVPLDPFVVATDLKNELEKLCGRILEYGPDLLVMGDPISLNGSRGIASTEARQIAEKLSGKLGLGVVLVDERLTSREAASVLAGIGVKGRELRRKVDSSSAVVILTHYLESGNSVGELIGSFDDEDPGRA